MTPNHHWQAFTLAEMVVAMVITSILVGAAIYALHALQQSSTEWQGFQQTNLETQRGLQVLQYDIENAESVTQENGQLTLGKDSIQVTYNMGQQLVRQFNGANDTLLFEMEFIGLHQVPGTPLIDTLEFAVHYQTQSIHQVITKQYPFAAIAKHTAHGNPG